MSRKKKKVRRKRSKRSRKVEKAPTAKVLDLGAKQAEKMTQELHTLFEHTERLLDEQVERVVDLYREWERANPTLRLHAHHKMAMVRLGFVGPGGFDRCHETHRLPETAFISADLDIAEEIRRDRDASEVLMCPAMESGRCQGIWAGMRTPPCYLLLAEVNHGLGGGGHDEGVQEVVDDFGKWEGPQQYPESFARAERLIRHYYERDEPLGD